VLDLATVRDRYLAVRDALPEAEPYYAVKANATPELLQLLAGLGAGFDVASVAETEQCLALGVPPQRLSYSNTIKKGRDIGRAFALGVRTFTTDSEMDLAQLAQHAPGSGVSCRILIAPPGSATPFGRKFGCAPQEARFLLQRAHALGLQPIGVSFHVGSQQREPEAFDAGIRDAARVLVDLGLPDPIVNLGGGFPVAYREPVPPLAAYATAIRASVARHFGAHAPRLAIEPGRAIVADAGIIRTEVVLVTRRPGNPEQRWVYLDVGRYGGLAETENEAIAYPIRALRDGPVGPVCIAGPTADGDDVLYQSTPYALPLDLRAGDRLDLLGTGAYTAAYAAPAFHGAGPLATHVLACPER
jgi:ornithine decarboxylase